jgi:hypothetical protein
MGGGGDSARLEKQLWEKSVSSGGGVSICNHQEHDSRWQRYVIAFAPGMTKGRHFVSHNYSSGVLIDECRLQIECACACGNAACTDAMKTCRCLDRHLASWRNSATIIGGNISITVMMAHDRTLSFQLQLTFVDTVTLHRLAWVFPEASSSDGCLWMGWGHGVAWYSNTLCLTLVKIEGRFLHVSIHTFYKIQMRAARHVKFLPRDPYPRIKNKKPLRMLVRLTISVSCVIKRKHHVVLRVFVCDSSGYINLQPPSRSTNRLKFNEFARR